MWGTVIGGTETFFYVFAQEELGASTSYIGYIDFTYTLLGLVTTPLAGPIIYRIGCVNAICASMVGPPGSNYIQTTLFITSHKRRRKVKFKPL